MDKIWRVTEIRSGAGATGMNKYQSGSDWLSIRTGALTGSRLVDAMDFKKDGSPGAKRVNLMKTVLAERLTGDAAHNYVSKEMQWGIDNEDAARAAYELRTGRFVKLCGFAPHPTIDFCGASADGLIESDGVFEAKCPNTTTHISYAEQDEAPEMYWPQMTLEIICTNRKWADFVSFDPRIKKPSLQLIVRRFEPSEEYRNKIEQTIINFLEEVDARWELLTTGD